MKVLRALGYVWSAPYGLLGLLLWLGFRAAGAKPLPCGCPLALDCSKLALGRRMAANDWAAFTLAWTILVWETEPDDRLLVHEARHITQALVLGPIYPVLYLACWLSFGTWYVAATIVARARRGQGWSTYRVSKIPGAIAGLGYHFNPFERDARRAAGEEA